MRVVRLATVGHAAWLAARLTAGAVAATRLARAAHRVPPLEPDLAPLTGTTVSVVVPARDEEARLGRLLEALASDPTPHELVVVDDESSDGTAALATAAGATVVRGVPVPAGWVGKPWALQQGLHAATGEWVVTLDADTVPRPGLLAALVRRSRLDGWDLLTAGGRSECPDRLQQVLHPSMLTTLVYRFGPAGSAHRPPPARVMANGQCTVFRRDRLMAAGGFRGAAGHLTDDIALARHLAALGWTVGFLDGAAAFDVRMYDSAAEAWLGWGRSLPMPDVTSPAWRGADLAVIWLAQALPLARLATGRGDLVDGALGLLRLGTLAGTRRAYRHGGWAYWASPLADVAVAARLTQATVRPETTWRGRTYPPPR